MSTFALEELMGTKLRALFQRSKGRDLFDLWYVLTRLEPDEAKIIDAFRHYIGRAEFSFPQLAQNLDAKLEDQGFRDDMLQLVATNPENYDPETAADVVMERLGARLRNAPGLESVRNGSWRS